MSRQPFENLKYRIHNIPKSADLMEEFPDLKRHETLTFFMQNDVRITLDVAARNEMLRYLIYLYDQKSDLIRQEPELTERKRKASELSGFTNFEQSWVLEKAFYFLTRVYNDRKFREWCTLQQELEEKQKARWTPINEEDTKDQKQLMEAHEKKGKLRDQAMAIHKVLDVLEPEIFGDNEDLKQHANELLLTTPEKIAGAYA
jgi:hypothetical protein